MHPPSDPTPPPRTPWRVRLGWMFVGGALVVAAETALLMLSFSGDEPQGYVAELSISRIHEKAKIFEVKKRRLPSSIDELYAGETVPKDPWGEPFHWETRSEPPGYDIVSYGADGAPGGSGTDADIRLSDLD